MIKRIFCTFVIVITLSATVFAEVFQYVGEDFDWAILSPKEKTERVEKLYKIMFPDGAITNYTRKEFKTKFKTHLKDKDSKIHYDAMVAGYKDYKNVKLEPYYYKNTGCIYMYALQYKNDLTKTYYYSVLGNLKFVDIRYGDLINCPCYIKKYGIDGKLKRSAYIQSKDIIYTYTGKGKFEGVQYKSTMYTH